MRKFEKGLELSRFNQTLFCPERENKNWFVFCLVKFAPASPKAKPGMLKGIDCRAEDVSRIGNWKTEEAAFAISLFRCLVI